jgi:hypothetical protein
MDYILTESYIQRHCTTGEFEVLELRRFGCTYREVSEMTTFTTGQVYYKARCVKERFSCGFFDTN